MRRRLHDNGLSIFFLAIFAVTLAAQSVAGQRRFNEEQATHGQPLVDWARYVTSSDFWQAVLENWQSEYLQFLLFILATIWLIQVGSPESKEPGKEGLESDEDQKVGEHAEDDSPLWAKAAGWRRTVYSNSLLLLFGVAFAGSWLGHSMTGWRTYNEEQREHREATVAWSEYVRRPDFWETTLQNWQSEFLAVGSMAIFAVYLRQRGSPESKPVGSPHTATGVEG